MQSMPVLVGRWNIGITNKSVSRCTLKNVHRFDSLYALLWVQVGFHWQSSDPVTAFNQLTSLNGRFLLLSVLNLCIINTY